MRVDHRAWSRSLLAWFISQNPLRVVVLGYLSYVVVGWLALCLPWSREGAAGSWLDHLFTAVSAMSTTGLATISTSDAYSWLGEAIVLALIQLGGLGYMTIGSFVVLTAAGNLSPFRRRITRTAIALPGDADHATFIRLTVYYTLLVESIGAWLLHPHFAAHGAEHPWWQAIFHSVSAFCTAGFGLYNNSMENFRADAGMNAIIIVLSYLGAIGFIVVHDVWLSLRHRRPHVTLTTKIILLGTTWIAVAGTLLLAFDEPSLRTLPAGERWLAAFFQVMSAGTTVGFNTVPIGALSASSLFLLTLVMMIGASPAGTGGGIKITTVTALWAEMMAVLRGRDTPVFMQREIPHQRIRAATAHMMFYCLILATGLYLMSLFETAALADQLFECASALGTVGLSRGITGALTDAGKLILIALMFLGRVGPLALAMALLPRPANESIPDLPEEDVTL